MSVPPKVPESAAAMKSYAVAGVEPALSDVLDDPIVHLVMARDGVTRGDLELLIERVRRNGSAAPDRYVGGDDAGPMKLERSHA